MLGKATQAASVLCAYPSSTTAFQSAILTFGEEKVPSIIQSTSNYFPEYNCANCAKSEAQCEHPWKHNLLFLRDFSAGAYWELAETNGSSTGVVWRGRRKGDEEEYRLNHRIYDTENILTMATSRRRSKAGTVSIVVACRRRQYSSWCLQEINHIRSRVANGSLSTNGRQEPSEGHLSCHRCQTLVHIDDV